MEICGQLVDIHQREIYPAIIRVIGGKIENINKTDSAPEVFILPGLIDSHIHIESSMITPGAFAMAAVKHGTVAVVSDPHEIANVLGMEGIRYMLRDAERVPVKFHFGAPSCVPATIFETNGASVGSEEIKKLLELPEIKY
jgi:adenine deaminase